MTRRTRLVAAGLVAALLAACASPVLPADAGHDSQPSAPLDAGYVAHELDAAPPDAYAEWQACRAYYRLVHARCTEGEMAPLCPAGIGDRLLCLRELGCTDLLADVRRPMLCR